MSTNMAQSSLWDVIDNTKPQQCHVKGCAEPVVGSSTIKQDGYVCKRHNDTEWATALSRGTDSYWRMFGRHWLAELEGRDPMSAILTRDELDTLLRANKCATSEFQHKNIRTKQGETDGYVVYTCYAGKSIKLGLWDVLNQQNPEQVMRLIVKKISEQGQAAV